MYPRPKDLDYAVSEELLSYETKETLNILLTRALFA
jgi:hypothetical protein